MTQPGLIRATHAELGVVECGCQTYLCDVGGCREVATAAHRFQGVTFLCQEHSGTAWMHRTLAFAIAPAPDHTCTLDLEEDA